MTKPTLSDDVEQRFLKLLDGAGSDPAMLAYLITQITDLSSALRTIRYTAEARCHDALTRKVIQIDGIGRIERVTADPTKKWESQDLLKKVVHVAVDPQLTGELPATAEAIERVRKAVEDCLPMSASVQWKVTGLRKYMDDEEIDQYVTTSGGRKSVRIN